MNWIFDMPNSYKYEYNTYPVFSDEMSHEGAFTRFMPFPLPKEVFDYAMFGLPKYAPITGEPITPAMLEPFLNSAINEIEMSLGCNISEVDHYHSEDYIDGSMTSNFMGYKLPRWPATQITQMQLKYPMTATASVYQKYTIPPNWIYLQRNKINVVAAVGSVTVSTDNSSLVTAGGIFTYISGFNRGIYQPGSIEIVYKAGFQHDKLPSMVVDLIKTWAAHRFLNDIIPVLFPNNGVSVSIDGVAQSVNFNISQMLAQRVQALEQKKKELSAAFVKQFSKTIKTTYIGS